MKKGNDGSIYVCILPAIFIERLACKLMHSDSYHKIFNRSRVTGMDPELGRILKLQQQQQNKY